MLLTIRRKTWEISQRGFVCKGLSGRKSGRKWREVRRGVECPQLCCQVFQQFLHLQLLKMDISPSSSDDGLSNSHLSSPSTPLLVPLDPEGGGKATPASKNKKVQRMDRGSEEYRLRRERNNMAVKKSRLKSKQKAQDTLQRVNQLKEENERLEAKIKLLTKELSVLKDLFLEHAHNLAESVPTETSVAGQDQATP